ncbi:nucleolysin TIA-1/TIAR, partial [Tremellales sp. Uapishka_1]
MSYSPAYGVTPGQEAPKKPHLYVGNLSPRVTDYMLTEIFAVAGPVVQAKIIQDRNFQHGGLNYGFVEYTDMRSAEQALTTLNGRKIFDGEIRVNWAYQGQANKEDTQGHYHVFVGDLSPEVNDEVLGKAFAAFGSMSEARVMWDMNSGKSRGYGFLSFRDKADADQAIATMNGEWLGSRAIRVNWANQKTQTGGVAPRVGMGGPPAPGNFAPGAGALNYENVNTQTPDFNTTVYVGNLIPYTTQADLIPLFQGYGYIVEIRMQADRGFAFVKLDTHANAALAITQLQNQLVHGRPIKCSWGKDRQAGDPLPTPIAGGGQPGYPVPLAYGNQYQQNYYPGYGGAYGQTGVPGQPGSQPAPTESAAAPAAGQWDQAAAAAYYQQQQGGWGGYYALASPLTPLLILPSNKNKAQVIMRVSIILLSTLTSVALASPIPPTIVDNEISSPTVPKHLHQDCDRRNPQCKVINDDGYQTVDQAEGSLGRQGGIVGNTGGNVLQIEGQGATGKSLKMDGQSVQHDLSRRAVSLPGQKLPALSPHDRYKVSLELEDDLKQNDKAHRHARDLEDAKKAVNVESGKEVNLAAGTEGRGKAESVAVDDNHHDLEADAPLLKPVKVDHQPGLRALSKLTTLPKGVTTPHLRSSVDGKVDNEPGHPNVEVKQDDESVGKDEADHNKSALIKIRSDPAIDVNVVDKSKDRAHLEVDNKHNDVDVKAALGQEKGFIKARAGPQVDIKIHEKDHGVVKQVEKTVGHAPIRRGTFGVGVGVDAPRAGKPITKLEPAALHVRFDDIDDVGVNAMLRHPDLPFGAKWVREEVTVQSDPKANDGYITDHHHNDIVSHPDLHAFQQRDEHYGHSDLNKGVKAALKENYPEKDVLQAGQSLTQVGDGVQNETKELNGQANKLAHADDTHGDETVDALHT